MTSDDALPMNEVNDAIRARLRLFGESLGNSHGWQAKAARTFNLTPEQVSRVLHGGSLGVMGTYRFAVSTLVLEPDADENSIWVKLARGGAGSLERERRSIQQDLLDSPPLPGTPMVVDRYAAEIAAELEAALDARDDGKVYRLAGQLAALVKAAR